MNIIKVENMKSIANLFKGWNDTMIWSCLQGYMGEAWADDYENPSCAQIIIADFCFFAGKANKDLVLNKPDSFKSDFIIMVPTDESWSQLIEDCYKTNSKKISRYAIKKEPHVFDTDKLNKIVENITPPFKVEMIDEKIYNQAMQNEWSKDLCSHFKNYDDYKNRALGAAVLYNEEIVSGASSYSVYNEGIEIEIDTREDFRRKGLALACGAKLILECLKRGLYPSWDAQNKWSVALSEKLGYHFDKEYTVYEIYNY